MSVFALKSIMRGGTATPDKYDLQASDCHQNDSAGATSNNGAYPGFRNTNGRTVVSPDLVGGQKTLVIIVAGQSNACSVSTTPYVPSNSLVHNLNIYDGGVYRMTDPPLGCSHTPAGGTFPAGCWIGRLGDKLINASIAARVIMVPVAHAGSYVRDWDPTLTTTSHYANIKVALLRCTDRGYTPDAIIWMQGEGDKVAATLQAAYQAALGNVIAQSRTDGYTGPWFINQTSWINSGFSATIAAAQAAVVNHGTKIWAGANTDAYNDSFRLDTCHFNDTGMDNVATDVKAALALYGAPFV